MKKQISFLIIFIMLIVFFILSILKNLYVVNAVTNNSTGDVTGNLKYWNILSLNYDDAKNIEFGKVYPNSDNRIIENINFAQNYNDSSIKLEYPFFFRTNGICLHSKRNGSYFYANSDESGNTSTISLERIIDVDIDGNIKVITKNGTKSITNEKEQGRILAGLCYWAENDFKEIKKENITTYDNEGKFLETYNNVDVIHTNNGEVLNNIPVLHYYYENNQLKDYGEFFFNHQTGFRYWLQNNKDIIYDGKSNIDFFVYDSEATDSNGNIKKTTIDGEKVGVIQKAFVSKLDNYSFAEDYKNNYSNSADGYVGRVLIFKTQNGQPCAALYGKKVGRVKLSINKYITNTSSKGNIDNSDSNNNNRRDKDNSTGKKRTNSWKNQNAIEVGLNNTVTYKIVIKNSGNGEAKNVVFTDEFDSSLEFVETDFGDRVNGQNKITGTIDSISGNSSKIINVTLKVKNDSNITSGSVLKNKATYEYNNKSASSSDYVKITNITINKYVSKIEYPASIVSTNNRVSTSYRETYSTKETNPASITPGAVITYTIKVKSEVQSEFEIYDVLDNTDNKLTYQSSGSSSWTSVTANKKYKISYNTSGQKTYTIKYKVNSSISYNTTTNIIYKNTAYAIKDGGTKKSSDWVKLYYTDNPYMTDTADGLSYKKYIIKVNGNTISPDRKDYSNEDAQAYPVTLKKGDKVTYRLAVKNISNEATTSNTSNQLDTAGSKLKNIVITDTLDSGLDYQSSGNTSISLTNIANNVFQYKFANINVGSTATIDVTMTVTKSDMYLGLIQNSFVITSGTYDQITTTHQNVEFTIETGNSGGKETIKYEKVLSGNTTTTNVNIKSENCKNLGNSDYVQMDDVEIGGKVWMDGGADGLYGNKPDAPGGVVAKLYRKNGSTLECIDTKEIIEKGNSVTSPDPTVGDYTFGKIAKGNIAYTNDKYPDTTRKYDPNSGYYEYYVEFEYSGIKYISTPNYGTYEASSYYGTPAVTDANDWFVSSTSDSNYYKKQNWFIQSHASEEFVSTNNRSDFNDSFETVAYNSAYYGQTGDDTKKDLAYSYLNHVATINSDLSTNIIARSVPIFAQDAAGDTIYIENTEYLKHINLGLLRRETADLELTKDVYMVEYTINGYNVTYVYDKLGEGEYTVSDYNKISEPYKLCVYREDYAYRTDNYNSDEIKNFKTKNGMYDNDLNIIITYKVTVKNTSNSDLDAKVREIVDYYTDEMTLENVYFDNNAVTFSNTSNFNKLSTSGDYSYDGYNTKFISTESTPILSKDEFFDIYLVYKVNKDASKAIIIDDEDDEMDDVGKINIAEISTYSIYEKGTNIPAGLVDCDSNPGDINKNHGVTDISDTALYEDDVFQTSIMLVCPNINPPSPSRPSPRNQFRNISGNVWEELNETSSVDGQIVGDGIKDANDVGAQNIIVKLYEVTTLDDGIDRLSDTGAWRRTDSAGNYCFGDGNRDSSKGSIDDYNRIHSGRYIVRFIYGDEYDKLVTYYGGKTIRYSGQDFKSTVYKDVAATGRNDGKIEEDEIIEATDFAKIGNSTIYSVAEDNELRRMEVDSYSTTMTYITDTVLKANSTDEKKILAENTAMYADTKKFNLQISQTYNKGSEMMNEYVARFNNYVDKYNSWYKDIIKKYTGESLPDLEKKKFVDVTKNYWDRNFYDIKSINFGLIERPITKLQLMNDISEIKATLSNGSDLLDIFFDIKYTRNDDGSINHTTSINKEKSRGFEEVQALNRNGLNQGFRYVNVDSDLLQGMVITIKFKIAVANTSEIDHTTDTVANWIENNNKKTELEVEYEDSSNPTIVERTGNKIIEKIGQQTRTYNYENNELFKQVQILKNGLSNTISDYNGGTNIGSDKVNTAYTYHNIKAKYNDYYVGKYVGNMYYRGTLTSEFSSNPDIKVKSKVEQYIDYVDNDLEFKPEENTNQNGSSKYVTYTIEEIAKKGLLRDITNTTTEITDGEKTYYSVNNPANNNLAFNVESSDLNNTFCKFMEVVTSEKVDDTKLFTIELQASKTLTSEISLNGVVIDNIAEIVKVTNVVGRKVYVATSNNVFGYLGNTTKNPIESINAPGSTTTLVDIAKLETDTDFTEYVTFSPPTGLIEEQAIVKTITDKTGEVLLIAIPLVIIIAGISYVTVQVIKRKKFYK